MSHPHFTTRAGHNFKIQKNKAKNYIYTKSAFAHYTLEAENLNADLEIRPVFNRIKHCNVTFTEKIVLRGEMKLRAST